MTNFLNFPNEKANELETKARNAIWSLGQTTQDLDLSISAFVWGQTAQDYRRLIKLSKELRKQSKAVKKAIEKLRYIQIGVADNE